MRIFHSAYLHLILLSYQKFHFEKQSHLIYKTHLPWIQDLSHKSAGVDLHAFKSQHGSAITHYPPPRVCKQMTTY